jgi:hypothetical protein
MSSEIDMRSEQIANAIDELKKDIFTPHQRASAVRDVEVLMEFYRIEMRMLSADKLKPSKDKLKVYRAELRELTPDLPIV